MKPLLGNTLAFIAVTMSVLAVTSPGIHARTIPVRRAAALQRAVEQACSGDTIVLHKGVYRLKESLRIEGKTDLVIRGEGACINGGLRIPLRRLHRAKEFGNGVMRVNLRRYPLGDIIPKGDPHLTGPSWSELFADGVPMRLSEWPDKAPIPLDSVVIPGRGYIRPAEGDGYGVIAFKEDRPLEWRYPGLGWLWGCFRFGWTSELVPIRHIGQDKTIEAGSLTLKEEEFPLNED